MPLRTAAQGYDEEESAYGNDGGMSINGSSIRQPSDCVVSTPTFGPRSFDDFSFHVHQQATDVDRPTGNVSVLSGVNGDTSMVDDESFYDDVMIGDQEQGDQRPRRLSIVSSMLHQRRARLVGVGLLITLLFGISLGTGINRRKGGGNAASASPSGNKLGLSFQNGAAPLPSWGLAATSERYAPIRDALVELHGGDRAPFASVDTHHHQALIFLADEDPRKLSPDDPSLAQRFALAMLFYSTYGMTWKSKASWMTGEDECNWEGVSCARDGIHVDELSLPDNGIKGVLGDLKLLRHLQRLDLSNNMGLAGTYLHDSLGKLDNLRALHLHHCGITGEVPPTIWTNHLESIDLSYNDLSGPIPPTIRSAVSLQKLLLEGNHFSGRVPPEISNLPLLNEIRCGSNKFEGRLPNFSGLQNLRVLSFFSNDLTGALPPISKDHIRAIDLSKNNFVGLMGTLFNDMPELMELKMQNNFLSDDLNKQVNLSSSLHLEVLHLNGNNFRADSFPDWVAPMINLREFYLFGNGAVKGAIPDVVCDLVDFVETLNVLAVDCNNVQCTCCTHCCTDRGVCQVERPEENSY